MVATSVDGRFMPFCSVGLEPNMGESDCECSLGLFVGLRVGRVGLVVLDGVSLVKSIIGMAFGINAIGDEDGIDDFGELTKVNLGFTGTLRRYLVIVPSRHLQYPPSQLRIRKKQTRPRDLNIRK